MLFLHVLADFHLQGILANMKQKDWWKEQIGGDNEKLQFYKHDWAVALLAHSFEWTFIIMLPIFFVYGFDLLVAAVMALNIIAHSECDNIKCNKKASNLVADQIIHIIQILLTWVVFIALL